jgi:hypothetical protein
MAVLDDYGLAALPFPFLSSVLYTPCFRFVFKGPLVVQTRNYQLPHVSSLTPLSRLYCMLLG